MPDDNFITINGANEPCASCQVQPGEPHRRECTGGMHDVIAKPTGLIAVQLSPRRWVLAKPRIEARTGKQDLMDWITPIYEVVGEATDYIGAVWNARKARGGPTVIRFPEDS